jgi:NADH-quinone oxidoreductase subunit N
MLSIQTDFLLFLPEIFFITTILILFLWSLFLQTSNINTKTLSTKLILLLIETILLTFILLNLNINKQKIIFFESLYIDSYTTNLKMLILGFTLIFYVLVLSSIKKDAILDFEFPILIALTVFSILILISAHDLITFYLSIEMQSLCLYILASFKKSSQLSAEAGLKYFVLGALSSSLMLFGMSFIYGFTGSTNFSEINKLLVDIPNPLSESLSLKLGLIFLLCGLLFKLTAAPFHIWSPDVYEGSPLISTIFFSTIPKFAIFSIFTRLIFSVFFNFYTLWQPLLYFSAGLTILIASLAALYQKKIKRFLAYSSITHVGYVLIGLSTGTLAGLHASILYMFIYVLTMFTLFGLILSIQKTNKNLVYITDLIFVKQIHPLNKFLFILVFFSLAGIPPLIGFFTKFYIFLAATEAQSYSLLLLGIFTSTLGTFYYIRLIKILTAEKTNNSLILFQKKNWNIFITLLGVLLFITFVISPNFIICKTYQIALTL